MLKNAQIGLQTTATKVMNGDRDWGNWALWDWLQAGKFVELGNEACSSPEFQGWIANAMKATVINAVCMFNTMCSFINCIATYTNVNVI